jgi:hypothetical protein
MGLTGKAKGPVGATKPVLSARRITPERPRRVREGWAAADAIDVLEAVSNGSMDLRKNVRSSPVIEKMGWRKNSAFHLFRRPAGYRKTDGRPPRLVQS